MKFNLTFKTPGALDAIKDELDVDHNDGSEERDALEDTMTEVVRKFVFYDEVVHIQFDTETQTATVLPTRKS